MRRVPTGALVHYEQTVRYEDAASAYGCTGALRANSQVTPASRCVPVHYEQTVRWPWLRCVYRYTTGKQSGDTGFEVCTGTLRANSQVVTPHPLLATAMGIPM